MGRLFDRNIEIYWWESILKYNKKKYFILYTFMMNKTLFICAAEASTNKTLFKAQVGRGLKSRPCYIQGIHGSA